jgi:hypothetical protein
LKGYLIVGPEIGELIQDIKFEDHLGEVEKAAWTLLKNVSTSFLGNHKAENCGDMVADLI